MVHLPYVDTSWTYTIFVYMNTRLWPAKTCLENSLLAWLCYLRNRSALAVNCWVIIHCLEVSCKEYQITSAQREWFIFVQLTDKQWIITQQFTHWGWSISILTQNKRRKHIWNLQLLPTFRHCTEELPPMLRLRRIHLHVFVTSFKRKTTFHRLSSLITSFSSNKWRQLARTFLAISKLWIIVWYITL